LKSRSEIHQPEATRPDETRKAGFFNALMDAAVDAIIIIDHQSRVLHFNPSAQRIFGYTEKEIVGQNVSVLMPESHRHKHDEYVNNYLDTGQAKIIGIGREEFGLRRNGDVFPMRLSVGETIRDDESFFVGIIHDLSEQRGTEDQLRFLEQKLFHADRLVTLGELTAGIAHEINQPLTAIAAYADAGRFLNSKNAALQAPASPESAAEHPNEPSINDIFERIGEQARRAGEVIERLRKLVRSEYSSKSAHDINTIIKNTLLLFDYDIKKTNIKLHYKPDHSLPLIFVDDIQIQQILVNLVKNGMDAIAESGRPDGIISIETEAADEELSIAVQDNGAGVTDLSLDRLFQPFYTSKPKGVGLGLSICKSIAVTHGGQLVHSRPSKGGARFTLRLPLASIG